MIVVNASRSMSPLLRASLLGVLLACGVTTTACEKNEPRTALSYTADAKRAYDEAMGEFGAHNWIEAQSLFREVKRKYSYSKYAKLAELGCRATKPNGLLVLCSCSAAVDLAVTAAASDGARVDRASAGDGADVAALFAAVTLEQHGYPPLLLSFESVDRLDHVIFVFRGRDGWGSIGRSRDPGLHGRRPVFATPRALALSYCDPYVDDTGRVRGYAVAHLAALGRYDWRFATGNVWAVEQLLIDWPHHRIRSSDARYRRLKARYAAYRAAHGVKPIYYARRDRWMPLPAEYRDRRPAR